MFTFAARLRAMGYDHWLIRALSLGFSADSTYGKLQQDGTIDVRGPRAPVIRKMLAIIRKRNPGVTFVIIVHAGIVTVGGNASAEEMKAQRELFSGAQARGWQRDDDTPQEAG